MLFSWRLQAVLRWNSCKTKDKISPWDSNIKSNFKATFYHFKSYQRATLSIPKDYLYENDHWIKNRLYSESSENLECTIAKFRNSEKACHFLREFRAKSPFPDPFDRRFQAVGYFGGLKTASNGLRSSKFLNCSCWRMLNLVLSRWEGRRLWCAQSQTICKPRWLMKLAASKQPQSPVGIGTYWIPKKAHPRDIWPTL